MKYGAALLAVAGLASARELPWALMQLGKREVPQEHSHESILRAADAALKLNNPLEIVDAVFALLGNAAAAQGAPNVQNLDCLQQIVADQAFTNAKAAGDLDGMINAILFRALERNTLKVGLASELCNETATNPEIANIQQHQDPASPNAAEINKQVELEVAKSLASIGADPLLALKTATFAPGDVNDPTAKGNSCNDETDPVGCIFTLNLAVPAATEEEILAAVSGVDSGAGNGDDTNVDDGTDGADECEAIVDDGSGNDTDAGSDAGADNDNADSGSGNNDSATGTVNIQAFTGTLGGPPPPVESTPGAARPFSVNGNTFLNAAAAIQRSCAIQKNACANAANSGQLQGGTQQCDQQEAECRAANNLRKRRVPVTERRQFGGQLDFGSCGSPAIRFAEGLDGRKEASFQNVNLQDFNHGSALNIRIIADFTCQRLQSSCKAPQETVQACQAGAQAAQGQSGQAAANAFNSALGVSA